MTNLVAIRVRRARRLLHAILLGCGMLALGGGKLVSQDNRLDALVQKSANTPGNLLANGSFEPPYHPAVKRGAQEKPRPGNHVTGVIARGWEDNSHWAELVAEYSADEDATRNGARTQRIDIQSIQNGWLQFVTRFNVRKDKAYCATLWMRSADMGTVVELRMRQAKPPYRSYFTKRVLLSPEWRMYTLTGSVTEDAPAFFAVLVQGAGEHRRTIWLDDARVEEADSVTASDVAPRTGNLIANGSFETGLTGGWQARHHEYRYLEAAIKSDFDDPRPVVDKMSGNAIVGDASLRFEIPDARAVRFHSPFFTFNHNRPHTASIWLKASKPTPVQLEFEGMHGSAITVQPGPEWKRFSTTVPLPYAERTRFLLRIQPTRGATTVWCDGAMVEERSTPSDGYAAPFPCELSLRVPRPGHIVFDGENIPLEINVAATGDIGTQGMVPSGARVQISVNSITGRTWAMPDVPVAANIADSKPDGRKDLPLQLALEPDREQPRGLFKATARLLAKDGTRLSADAELVFARLPRPREIAPEKSYFGVHAALTPELIAIARATGARWVRLHDCTNVTKWRYVEAKPGVFEFEDRGVDAARAAGIQILGMLDGAPPWISSKPRATLGARSVYNMPDGDNALAKWEYYVTRTVTHYKGRIDHWEVWNEPWAKGFFPGTPEQFARLQNTAFTAAKASNRQALIVGCNSVAHSNMGDEWTTSVLRFAGPDRFDVLSVHNYDMALYGGPKAKPFEIVKRFDSMMAAIGTKKPIWNTEGGPGELYRWYGADEQILPLVINQMAQIVRFDIVQRAAGIERFFYYSLYNEYHTYPVSWSATESDRSLMPAMAARAVLASLTDGTRFLGRSESERGVDAYAFFDDQQGVSITVLWSYDGKTHTITVPPGAKVIDIMGNSLQATGEQAVLTATPVYFVQ